MKLTLHLLFAILMLIGCNPNADQSQSNAAKPETESSNESKKDANNADAHTKSTQEDLSEDKIQSLKVAYFTSELNLSTQEAEKFWPIYNKHNRIYQDLGDTEWNTIKEGLREVDTYTDQEASQLLARYKLYLNQRLENRLNFMDDLSSVISAKKIMQLKHAEYNFNKKLLKQYRSSEATTK
ncbi:hypothetical protein [Psychroflexus salis]|nr:hypothetical protein [Psychroflexus salis]